MPSVYFSGLSRHMTRRWIGLLALLAGQNGCSDSDQTLVTARAASGAAEAGPDVAPNGTDEAAGAVAPGPAYLFASNVADGKSSNTYVLVLSELSGTVDIERGLEVPGNTSIFTKLGAVFVGNSEDLTVTRYEVDRANQLLESRRFSLAGAGVTSLDTTLFFVLDAERAYYVDSSGGQIIVWNPTTMAITRIVPLMDLHRNGFAGAVFGYNEASTWLLEETGTLYLPVAWTNYDAMTAEPVVALLTISATDPTQQQLHTSACAAISDEGLVLGRDGNIYLAGTNQFTIFHQFGGMPESALARFDIQAQSFDAGYCQNLPALTGGHEVGTLIAYAPGEFVVRALDESLTEIGLSDTYWTDIENACRFYRGSIDEDGQLTVEEEPSLGTAPHYCWGWVHKVNGSPYFWGDGTMFKWDGSSMVPAFQSPTGFATTLQRIR